MTFLKAPHSSLSRSRKNGTATGVDAICAYYQDPAHPGMDIKELYTELRNLTQGITQLGNYSLDKDSLYVNGECSLWFVMECPRHPLFFLPLSLLLKVLSISVHCIFLVPCFKNPRSTHRACKDVWLLWSYCVQVRNQRDRNMFAEILFHFYLNKGMYSNVYSTHIYLYWFFYSN